MSLAERLKYGRERANLTGEKVQEKTGIGASSLSEFENGKREPKLSQLQNLATLYHRSISFFLEEGPIPREVVLWRERPDNAEDIEARFLRLCKQYKNLEEWCGERTESYLPEVSIPADEFNYPQAVELAGQARRNMELGDHPANELLCVLEEVHGIKVFHNDFNPTGPAASAKSQSFGMAILLNRANVRWRRNYDLAHELFHLLTWDVFHNSGEESSAKASEHEENLANKFAAHLLMPDESVKSSLMRRARNGRIRYEALYDVAREFDVSIASLLWRMHWLKNRTPEEAEKTRCEIVEAERLEKSLPDRNPGDNPPDLPERYCSLAVQALRQGEISIGRFAEYLGISRQKAMTYVEQETANSETIPIPLA